MQRLRVLITNIWMSGFGGSEAVTRDIALGLLRRGHFPTVYTPELGPSGEELRRRGVPVIDDLTRILVRPDVIHAHHVTCAAEAIARFPYTPCINGLHAWVFGVEAPVVFPQVRRWLAVDEAVRERALHAPGVDPDRVRMLFNAVDLTRHQPRPPLPERPRRAVMFGKAAYLEPVLAAACAAHGVELVKLFGQPDPERILAEADIVFASARAALEALCTGCAVVVCDTRGFAGLVTPDNFSAWRAKNFGVQLLQAPVNVANVGAAIAAYDPQASASLREMARKDADLETYLDQLLALYAEVIAEFRGLPFNQSGYELALSAFLRDVLPRHVVDPFVGRAADHAGLQARCLALEGEVEFLKKSLAEALARNPAD